MAKAKLSQQVAPAYEFNRISSLGQAMDTSVRMHDDLLYEQTQHKLPMTNAQFEAAFGTTIPLFGENQAADCPGKQVSPLLLDNGPELDDFFWLTGITLVAFGEPKSFSINGGILAARDAAVPCFTGCPDAEGTPVSSQATLYHGGPTWQFLYNFLNAYRFRWLIRRYEYLNIGASDLGITHMGPEFVGAGASQVPAMPYIQAVNETMTEIGRTDAFIPQNAAGEEPVCVGAPTADVTYGAIKLNGAMNRPYCLTQPMLLAPGMHLKMAFERVENDCCYYEGMRRNAIISEDSLPYAEATSATCFAGAVTIPSGCFTIGVALLGRVMDEAACWEALTRNVVAGSPMHSVLKGNAAVAQLIQRKGRIAGALTGVSQSQVQALKELTEATGG